MAVKFTSAGADLARLHAELDMTLMSGEAVDRMTRES
jgi:hypothetical protein